MAGLLLKNVAKLYPNGGVGVKDFSLEIGDGEFTVLVGPAGSGKSTLLRMIGGLEDISLGDIYIGGVRVNDLEPRERNVAMIFRNYMLYPQMTVYENLAFGLKLTGCGKNEMHQRVTETAELLEIGHLLETPSEQVTGIDRYKVVVGRALARRPQVLLMDDPMIRLDGQLRREMRQGLADLHHRLGVTVVYVTEDASEAMLLGTRLAVIRDGVLEQTGTPEEIIRKPQNRFVAEYFSCPPMNVLAVEVEEKDGKAVLKAAENRGVFSEENSRILEAAKSYREDGDYNAAKRKALQRMVFLPKDWMRSLYPALKKHPALLPFCHLHRWGKILINRKQNLRRLYDTATVEPEEIDALKQLYKGMGIDHL